jgi:hypothetical protein
MSRTELPTRPKLEERIRVALTPDEKHRLFAFAADRRLTVSEFVRSAIARAEGELAA